MAEQNLSTYYNNGYKFNAKELDVATGMYYYGARYYDPKTSLFLSVDPLAEDFPGWTPYHYVHNNPINLIDPTGMAAEENDEWVKKGNTYFWDDRVTSQETASKYHGGEAKHIGVDKTVSTDKNGKTVDSVTLSNDGSMTKGNKTVGVNSNEKLTNQSGSTFISRQTQGSFLSIGVDGALMGGFGFQVGLVSDAVGDTSFFINFNANIGVGGGAGWDAGTISPTGDNQFLNSDFDGNSGGYNAGISTPILDASWGKGGSVDSNWHATNKMNHTEFGANRRGYKTTQSGFSTGSGFRAGGMYSYGTTKVF
ncbi:RHS repeat-associated core domain-containing protein [Flavobacterium sp. JP2137]|uniref:RHS repeat-associated core domain-containing protein n=1 Tax=Flavobacterium sp. JP2137 TaxID=3414510 RepID=UPI003D2FB48B